VLQRTTTNCNALHHTATQCKTQHQTAAQQFWAIHELVVVLPVCVLQCVAVCCGVVQRGAVWCSVVQRVVFWWSVLLVLLETH